MTTGQKAFNQMRKDVDHQISLARSEGFIDGYVQVYVDELIDVYQLIEGLAYWDINIQVSVLNNQDYSWLDDDQRSEILEALNDE
jgi:hypothetical protein